MGTKNTLNFAQRYQIADAIKAATEPTGEADFVRYVDTNMTDAGLADKLAAQFGYSITAANVEDLRKQVVGRLRGSRSAADTALRDDIEALRAVVAGMAQKLENLRKVVEHFDAHQHRRRGDVSAKLREIIKGRVDDRVMRTQMRGAGYSDDEIATGLYLVGAVIRNNGAGSTVEIPLGGSR